MFPDYENWPDVVINDDLNVLDAHKILNEKRLEAIEAALADEKMLPIGPLRGEKPESSYHLENMVR